MHSSCKCFEHSCTTLDLHEGPRKTMKNQQPMTSRCMSCFCSLKASHLKVRNGSWKDEIDNRHFACLQVLVPGKKVLGHTWIALQSVFLFFPWENPPVLAHGLTNLTIESIQQLCQGISQGFMPLLPASVARKQSRTEKLTKCHCTQPRCRWKGPPACQKLRSPIDPIERISVWGSIQKS